MRIKIEFSLEDIYIDEFLPYREHKLFKIIRDIKLAEESIINQLKFSIEIQNSYDASSFFARKIRNINSFDDLVKLNEEFLKSEQEANKKEENESN